MKDLENAWIIIPAREGSKGFPNKNRFLFDYTAKQIPSDMCYKTIVTTDDEKIKASARERGFLVLGREEELSQDKTKMGHVIQDVVRKYNIGPDENIITLYLTYPQRTFEQTRQIYNFYLEKSAVSLLCKKDVESHPYKCFYEEENFKASKVIENDLYRRQDYPKCFEACHYVVINKVSVLASLDNNLYCPDTVFYPLEKKIFDVDYLSDFKNFKEGEN